MTINYRNIIFSVLVSLCALSAQAAGTLTYQGRSHLLMGHILSAEKGKAFGKLLKDKKPDKVYDSDNYMEYWSVSDDVLTLDSLSLLIHGRWETMNQRQLVKALKPLAKHKRIEARWYSDTLLTAWGKQLFGDAIHNKPVFEHHVRLVVAKGHVVKQMRTDNRVDFEGLPLREWSREVQRKFPVGSYPMMAQGRVAVSLSNITWIPKTGIIDRCSIRFLKPNNLTEQQKASIQADLLRTMKGIPMRTYEVDGKICAELQRFILPIGKAPQPRKRVFRNPQTPANP